MDNEKSFAIKLADNEKKVRDKALIKMRNYIRSRSKKSAETFSEEDLIKLWKGLHYSMWMCDKLLIQEELSTRIASLISSFNENDEQVLLFFKVYFLTIIREWNKIDKWRMDKFMMMMRDMLKQMLAYLSANKWSKPLIKQFNKIMLEHPLNINDNSVPDGISYHVSDIYLEELAKFGDSLKPIRAVKMLEVFFKSMAVSQKKAFVVHLHKRLFDQIIECSDVGINPEVEHELEEITANALQTGEEEDTSEYILKFNYNKIAERLFKIANSNLCLLRNKKQIYDLVKKFRALAKGVYPIDDYNFTPLHDEPYKKKKPIKINYKNKKSKKAAAK